MTFHTYRIDHYGKNSDGSYKATPVVLTDIIAINVTSGLGETADSFSFTQVNYNDNLFDASFSVRIDDIVKIYGSVDGVTYTLLLDGLVNAKNNQLTTDSKIITYSGLNRLEKLFNSLVSTTGEPVQRPASYWIQNIIDQVNNFNQLGGTNREITYDTNSITQLTSTYNISFVRGYERAFKLIEELSRPDLTDEQVYIYYLDNTNKFHWKPRPQTVTETLNIGTDILSHRTNKAMYEIINYIIMNAGKNIYGATILQVDYDIESINKYGWKSKLITQEDIASTLYDEDRKSKPERWDDDNDFPTSYPYVTVWGQSTTSDDDYNDKFVDKVLAVALIRIAGLLQKNTGASFKTDLTTLPTFGYVLGDIHKLLLPDNTWTTAKSERIDSIKLSFSTDGWSTILGLKEDEEFVRET